MEHQSADNLTLEALQNQVRDLSAMLRHRERQIAAIQKTGEALFEQNSVDEMVQSTLQTALDVLQAESGSLLLHDEISDELVFRYVIGPAADKLTGFRMPSSQGIAGRVFGSGESDLVQHAEERADFNRSVDENSGYKTDSMMTVPVKRAGAAPIGVMQVLNSSGDGFDARDLEVLQALCAQAATAIETARLAQAARQAQIVNIIGDISHDIKNMLTPIQSGVWTLRPLLDDLFSDLEKIRAACPTTEPLANDIERILATVRDDYGWILEGALEACEQVQARTKEIADAVKGEAAPPFFEECNLNEIAREVLKPLQTVGLNHGVELRLELAKNLPLVECDRKQIYNALYNLVNNAIPETPSGGNVTLRTRRENEPSGAGIQVIEVQDTGKGIPPHVREKLFTDAAVSTKPGGTGLGTRIVAGVVRRHHGTISVSSEEGKGSTFSIRLPLRQSNFK